MCKGSKKMKGDVDFEILISCEGCFMERMTNALNSSGSEVATGL